MLHSPMTRLAAGACLVAASFAVPGTTATGATSASGASEARAVGQRLEANLRGGEEQDPDGTGHANFRLFPRGGKICARVTWENIATPTAAHIHRRSDGGIAVYLVGSVTGGTNCNTKVAPAKVRRILEHPRRYYFNIHNEPYPAGAIAGRLHR